MKRRLASLALCALLVLWTSRTVYSGGVLAVAGTIGFNPDVVGKPITWANGSLAYYTDLGDLSPVLTQEAANAFVADAFSRWTSVPTSSLSAVRGGALSEDINGSNVVLNGESLAIPAEIQATATNRPLGVVYDQDGAVTDALLGSGAGAATFCNTNSVYGGVDAYTPDAHFAHALLVLNGNCVQGSADLPTFRYKLLRVIGRILGVGWSQVNDNVRTGTPAPSAAEVSGFPLMHPRGPTCSVVSDCLTDYDQLRMDDRAAIAALYPALANATIRIRGSVFFTNERGERGQPMQGVNVVARWIDPVSGKASPVYAAASVSGFRFRGNSGNPVTGGVTPQGEAYARFGSDDRALEGYFELAGLELPPGQTSATYQLVIEPVNPLYKGEMGVGAARYGVVSPSGTIAPIALANLTAGADVVQDLVVSNSTRVQRDAGEPNHFTSPAPLPAGGNWWATLSGYGDADYYRFHIRGGRTFHLRVTALDETFTSSTVKAQPTLGLWPAGAAANSAPTVRVNAFNVLQNGQTRMSVTAAAEADLMLGITDFRGDGRPDFLYHARLLYADVLDPTRLPNGGGRVELLGLGFNANTTVMIGGANAPVLARSASRLVLQAPALGNGSAAVAVTDLATGDISTITAGAQYGAIPGDQLVVLASGNPGIPVGGTARFPMRVRAVTADGVTPIPRVPVSFVVGTAPSFLTECGAAACTITTDSQGEAAATIAVRAMGENTITASLANGSTVQDSVVGTAAGSSIYAAVSVRRVPQGTTVAVPLSVRVLSSGNPISGQLVTFSLGTAPTAGTAALVAQNVVTNSAGDAANTVNVTNLGASFTVLACLFGGSPCTTINVIASPVSNLQLQMVQNGSQLLTQGEAAAPILLRVTDGTNQNQRVKAATVSGLLTAFARAREGDCKLQNADCRPGTLRPLATSAFTLLTDDNGQAIYTPTLQGGWGAADVYVSFTIGAGAAQSRTAQLRIYK